MSSYARRSLCKGRRMAPQPPQRWSPNPHMQPTGRSGPGLPVGAALSVAKQWKLFIRAGADMIACS